MPDTSLPIFVAAALAVALIVGVVWFAERRRQQRRDEWRRRRAGKQLERVLGG